MKIEVHVPVEQYGFVAAEFDSTAEKAGEWSKSVYEEISNAFKPKPINSLPPKEYQQWLINQLMGDGNSEDMMSRMSPQQKEYSHEIKKALSTIKRRQTI